MKKISLILLMLISVSAFAQTEREAPVKFSAEEVAAERALRMAARLDLNESQQEKLKIVFQEQAQERQSLRAERRKARQETREARQKKRTERRGVSSKRQQALEESMKTILNEEQFKEWKELASEKRRHRSHRTGYGR